MEKRLLLDNIRSVHNVGSIFRTAETAAVAHIYCVGTTPVPNDRFGRKRNDFAKVALGAEGLVAWSYTDDAIKVVKQLKNEGFQIVVVEQAPGAIDYRKIEKKDKTLFIFGNEVGGVSKDLIDLADFVAEIPLKGKKESLNVSVAVGIALFDFML